ncbi:MAG TPA: TIGR01777 family oxidoreductase [Syntrophobacteraceae bacterium]|nr:TIGR01777 family oxidoreductase [Syntrophobacteraceae bacterium]
MRVFITGGTGFVGTYLVKRLVQEGHEVSVLSRSPGKESGELGRVHYVQGDSTQAGAWQEAVPANDLLINLAGASIFTYWTEKAKNAVLESRIRTTRNLVDALSGAEGKTTLLSASAVGYYGGRLDDTLLTEDSPPGKDFLARVAMAWEAEAGRAEHLGVRVVLCRFGIVMGRGGGALKQMASMFQYFLGSRLGSGKQWFPWIHLEDLYRAMTFLAGRPDISGPVNCVAPNPVRNAELTRTLARVLRKPILLPPAPAVALRLVLGEFGDLLLKGQRAHPQRLLREGFRFEFPLFEEAVRDLLS